MILGLEWKKMRRTGFVPAFFCGGLLAGAVPVLNMAVRSERYLGLEEPPLQVLMDANWQMMAMFNILLAVAGACLIYHTEYADEGMRRMCTLPMSESKLFFGKAALMVLMCLAALVIEAAGMAFCLYHWFGLSDVIELSDAIRLFDGIKLFTDTGTELLKSFGYALLLMLPAALCSLLIASACRNMWVSLGIGVVCVFTATMLPTKSFALSLFPFALPFQILAGTPEDTVFRFMAAATAELAVLAMAEILLIKIRRALQ